MIEPATQKRKQRLWEALLEAGAITSETLERGLARQTLTASLRLGETLVAMGHLAIHELVSVLHQRAADCLADPRRRPWAVS